MGLPKLYTLVELAHLLGNGVKVKSLRAEVNVGRLKAVRIRPSHNSKILVSEQDFNSWLQEHGYQRQIVRRPRR